VSVIKRTRAKAQVGFLRGETPFVELRRDAAGLRRGLAAPPESDP
jgi:hypothetical protein